MCPAAMQGRVACEVSAGNELVTTEIVFAGVLSELTPEEAVAILSALVFQVRPQSSDFQQCHFEQYDVDLCYLQCHGVCL